MTDETKPVRACSASPAEAHGDARALIEQCRDALAEELAAWDIDPPLHHVKTAHDACVAWLAQPQPKHTTLAKPVADGIYDNRSTWRRQCWSRGRLQWEVSHAELNGRIFLHGKPHPAWGQYPDLPALQAPAPAPAPDHIPAGPEIEASVDAKLGLVLLPPIRVDMETYAAIEKLSKANGMIVQATVRDMIWGACRATGETPAPAVGADDARDAARYRWIVGNSFDKHGLTQMQCWLHTWEPHSQTGEPTEWVQRIRGPALDRFIDAAMGESQPPVQGSGS